MYRHVQSYICLQGLQFSFSNFFETAVWIRGFNINGILKLRIKSELFGCEQISYR